MYRMNHQYGFLSTDLMLKSVSGVWLASGATGAVFASSSLHTVIQEASWCPSPIATWFTTSVAKLVTPRCASLLSARAWSRLWRAIARIITIICWAPSLMKSFV